MGKKRRRHPTLDEIISRAWCYYCERDFEDLKLLISHQKAKHFKCDRCGRRLNTAGGLSVHMNQVHKETLSKVENSLSNRQGLDVEIFGMEGIPDDIIHQHNQRLVQNYYQAQAERQSSTGNPPSGEGGAGPTRKKLRFETPEELKARLRDYVTRRRTEDPRSAQNPDQANPSFPAAQQQGYPQQPPPGAYPSQQYPQGAPPPAGYNGAGFPTTNLPARPTGAAPGLPQRPGQEQQQYGQGNFWDGQPGVPGRASTVDELVTGASAQGQAPDDIDQMIRMAEAGIKPSKGADEAPVEKKKKDKNRMVFSDPERCPEEIIATTARYS